MAKYADMTNEQLEAALTDLHAQVKALKSKKRAIGAVLSERAALAEATRAVAGLSEAGRAALPHVIGPNGIAPTSGVGTPGAA